MKVLLVIALFSLEFDLQPAGERPGIAGVPVSVYAVESGPVTRALREGEYPWYDAEADRIRPVWQPRMSWLRAPRQWIRSMLDAIGRFIDRFKLSNAVIVPFSGSVIATVVLLSVLFAFMIGLFMLWTRRESGSARMADVRTRLGTVARLGDLPEGLRPRDGDPWAEAQRRRAAGDLAGATVCLFAHQLLALDELGLIRLAPGKTGRHYVQALRDRELARALGATLRLFEDVYYGRRSPAHEPFESVWKLALSFQERRRQPGAGALS